MQRRTALRRIMAIVTAALAAAALAVAVQVPLATQARAPDDGLALTPPMGWNDWNAFGCSVSAQLVEQTAQAMVQDGMRRPARICEDSGTHTCSSHGFPGSLGQEYQDALTFAQWGVDYLKYDDCDIPASGQNAQSTIQRYDTMRDALLAARAKTGHDIVFSICEKTDYGVPNSTWPPVGNLWRTTGDIHDTYASMLSNFENNVQLFSLARPGAWNDPDMLEIGNGGMSVTEEQAELSGAWGAPWVRGGGQPPMAMAKTWRRRAGWAEPSVMVPVPLAGP